MEEGRKRGVLQRVIFYIDDQDQRKVVSENVFLLLSDVFFF
jgi:hypothetical protein